MRYNSIDAMRLIAAILVVSLHVPFSPIIGKFTSDIARIAVPFFLMCSGFFLYSTSPKVFKDNSLKSIKKAIYLLVTGTFIYLFTDFIIWHNWNRIIQQLILFSSWDFWFFNSVPFIPVGWYLMAFIYSILIIRFLYKFIPFPSLFWYLIMGIGFCWWFITGTYQSFFFDIPMSLKYNTCWIVCYPFLIMGMLIAHFFKSDLKKIPSILSNKVLILCIIFFSLSSIATHFVIKNITGSSVNGTGYISTIFLVVSIFLLLLKHVNNGKKLAYLGKNYSMYIYIYHVAINYALCALFGVRFTFPYNSLINLPFDYTIIINPLVISIFAAIIPVSICKVASKLILRNQ